MGVVISPSVSNLEDRKYLAIKRTGVVAVKSPVLDADACFLDIMNCNLPIPQFVDMNDITDEFKNDYFSYVYERSPSYTTVATITNQNTGEAKSIIDDTYGKFYDFGTFPLRPNVSGMFIRWTDVVELMGYGCYKITVYIYNAEILVKKEVDLCFKVMPFSCAAAHGTIRIKTNQTGYIHNGFDYRDLFFKDIYADLVGGFARNIKGWEFQLRLYGRMFPSIPIEESDYIQNANRVEFQIQEKTTDQFQLEIYHIYSKIGRSLIKDRMLSTSTFISDYNLNAYEVYRNKLVRKVSNDELKSNKLNSNIHLTFTMKETDEGTVKRIYG